MLTLSVLVASLSFATLTHQYCISNNLTDGTSFLVYQRNRQYITRGKHFEVTIAPPFVECCNLDGKICSKNQSPAEVVLLGINFFWDGFDLPTVTQDIRCVAAGHIIVYGNREKHWAKCSDSKGNVAITNLD
ncbi:hypothetical protein BDB01DRAFT_810746 [Pilobolus umbonatus]|nr:hypothetical protein BDB01DRAFT_810746 [Pilobolus umbonatus]